MEEDLADPGEEVDAQTSGRFYLAAMQEILILGLETWVVTPTSIGTWGRGVPPSGCEENNG